jgi:hypothetical protein
MMRTIWAPIKLEVIDFFYKEVLLFSSRFSLLVLAHRYSFNDGTPADSVGGDAWTALLANNATIKDGKVVLDKTGPYLVGSHVKLSPTIMVGLPSVSLEVWADINNQNTGWCKILQFGDPINNCKSIHCFRHRDTGNVCCTTCSASAYNDICSNTKFNGTKLHLVFSLDPTRKMIQMFTNGRPINLRYTTVGVPLLSSTDVAFLAAAPVTSDNTMLGSIDEFRVWAGVFDEATTLAHYERGPDNLSAGIYLQLLFTC